MRKILRQKFWSLGTPLGSLGPGSQGDVRPRACKCQIQVICGPCEPPVLVTLQGQAENPKTAGAWCEDVKKLLIQRHHLLKDVYFDDQMFRPQKGLKVRDCLIPD